MSGPCFQAWCVDGEPSELAAGVIAKAEGAELFPALRVIWRCLLHSTQRTLENVLTTDDTCQMLISHLVTRHSGGENDLGSFARALKNSPKLKQGFRDAELAHLDAIDELSLLFSIVIWLPPFI